MAESSPFRTEDQLVNALLTYLETQMGEPESPLGAQGVYSLAAARAAARGGLCGRQVAFAAIQAMRGSVRGRGARRGMGPRFNSVEVSEAARQALDLYTTPLFERDVGVDDLAPTHPLEAMIIYLETVIAYGSDTNQVAWCQAALRASARDETETDREVVTRMVATMDRAVRTRTGRSSRPDSVHFIWQQLEIYRSTIFKQ